MLVSNSRFIQKNEFQGTRDIAAYLSVPSAIQFMEEHNWADVQRDCHRLVVDARRKYAQVTGLPPICPESADWFMQMATHPLPPCDVEVVQKRIYDEFNVEIQLIEDKGQPFVRISVQGYNTERDVEASVEALAAVLSAQEAR